MYYKSYTVVCSVVSTVTVIVFFSRFICLEMTIFYRHINARNSNNLLKMKY